MSEVPVSLALGRFRRLPQRSLETWQAVVTRLPMWVEDPDDPDGPPFRPMASVWVSLRTGLMHVALSPEGKTATPRLAVDGLLEFSAKQAKTLGGRPARIEVRDEGLRAALEDALAGTGTDVAVVAETPALAEVLASLVAYEGGPDIPGALEAPGVTPERLRAFATAAAAFYKAHPWQHLVNDDLIVVEGPDAPKGLSHASILGNGGQQFGLAFFDSRKAFEAILDGQTPRRAHGVTFGEVDAMPFADLDAWEAHALPLAGPTAYPLAADLRRDRTVRRPDARALAHMEALLLALAATSEDELDAGRWSVRVETFDGPRMLTLTLPYLLEAEAGGAQGPVAPAFAGHLAERTGTQISRYLAQHEFASLDDVNAALDALGQQSLLAATSEVLAGRPLTSLERAQELAYGAMEAQGRLKIKRARQALAVSADCADAWSILGDEASTPAAALEAYLRAIDAGATAIGGPARMVELTGSFWSHLETRPYMRARLSAAEALKDLGRIDEACVHLRDLLRLNPNDNQGVRYLLLPALLDGRHDDEAGVLLDTYKDDAWAIWPYARALWLFRTSGDSKAARDALATADRGNLHVARFLSAPETLGWTEAPAFALGSREEGAHAARALLDAFEAAPGAMEWVQQFLSQGTRPMRTRRQRPVKER